MKILIEGAPFTLWYSKNLTESLEILGSKDGNTVLCEEIVFVLIYFSIFAFVPTGLQRSDVL
jgi:hypothetical protein